MGRYQPKFDAELTDNFPRAFDLLCSRVQLSNIRACKAMGENDYAKFWEARAGKRPPTKKQLISLIKLSNDLGIFDEIYEVLICGSGSSHYSQSQSRQLGLPLSLAHGSA